MLKVRARNDSIRHKGTKRTLSTQLGLGVFHQQRMPGADGVYLPAKGQGYLETMRVTRKKVCP